MRYGKVTMKYAGCEIIAVYNALFDIFKREIISLPDMISRFEKDGMVLSARFGTSPKALVSFLKNEKLNTCITTHESQFDQMGEESDTLILTMYNDRFDIFEQIHTVNISKSGGRFTAHNVYCNGSVVGPYDSISELIEHINRGRAKGISLIGIKKTTK